MMLSASFDPFEIDDPWFDGGRFANRPYGTVTQSGEHRGEAFAAYHLAGGAHRARQLFERFVELA